jgi:hypothetical protein
VTGSSGRSEAWVWFSRFMPASLARPACDHAESD